MQQSVIKIYSHSEYEASKNSLLNYYLFIYGNRFHTVVGSTENNQILKLTTFTLTNSTNIFNLKYDELKSFNELLEEANQKFKSRKIIICNNSQSFIPDSLLNIVEIEKSYELTQFVEPNSQVLYCKMHYNGIACMFNVNNEMLKFIRFSLPTADLYHGSLLFVKAIDEQKHQGAENIIHLSLNEDYIEIAVVNNGLRFYNTYHFDSETDIVYYVLAVAEQLKIDYQAQVYIYGSNNQLIALMPLLKKYISSVKYAVKPKKVLYPVSFNQFAEHEYFLESASLFCE
ncbi:MAG: DUF3822 family protein [Bacteroidia bacterium]